MDRFEQLKIIGRGNYGAAHLVVEKATGRKLVVKKVPIAEMSEEERRSAGQEVRGLQAPVEYCGKFHDGCCGRCAGALVGTAGAPQRRQVLRELCGGQRSAYCDAVLFRW